MSDRPDALKPRTIAAQALGAIEPETKGVALPVHVSTTFIRDPDNQYRSGYSYGRADNATVRQSLRAFHCQSTCLTNPKQIECLTHWRKVEK